MFGSACKGRILLFLTLRGNPEAGSNSVGRGMRVLFLRNNRRDRRDRGLSYRGIPEADSEQLFRDVAPV